MQHEQTGAAAAAVDTCKYYFIYLQVAAYMLRRNGL